MTDRAPPPSSAGPKLRLVHGGVDATPPVSPRRDTPPTVPGRRATPARPNVQTPLPLQRLPSRPAIRVEPELSSQTPDPRLAALQRLAAAQTARENKASAGLDPSDVRWAFAARVAESLDGGRTAILPPERRRRLVRLATGLGLREFDANLIIAVVQDGARTGEGALSRGVEHRLEMIRHPSDAASPPRTASLGWMVGASLLAAGAMLLWLVQWVTGA
ncbi:MAG: hypothetical protein ACF8SC_04710 [Phycisphaerales bacterium JB037]